MLNRKLFQYVCIPLIFGALPFGSFSEDEVSEVTDEIELNCLGSACSTLIKQLDNRTETPAILSEDDVYNFASTEKHTRGFQESSCATNLPCSSLPAECLVCRFNYTCVYGQSLNISCRAPSRCKGPREFVTEMTCHYCYQSKDENIDCSSLGYCNTPSNPFQRYRSNCTVKPHVICLGQRKFFKNVPCNWTSGYKWTTALILSITLGGFGADRFYLGYWQEGIGKLFSFGGAGVWTLIDVILVAVGYLKPADGSLYI